jgi:hypothetical protein
MEVNDQLHVQVTLTPPQGCQLDHGPAARNTDNCLAHVESRLLENWEKNKEHWDKTQTSNSVQQIAYWKANSRSSNPEIHRLLCCPKVNYQVYLSPANRVCESQFENQCLLTAFAYQASRQRATWPTLIRITAHSTPQFYREFTDSSQIIN